MAERVGFEPTVRLPVQRFSRPSHSTTLAPLRVRKINNLASAAKATKGEIGTELAPDYRFSTTSIASADALPVSRNICP
jgi:hypothetical protein